MDLVRKVERTIERERLLGPEDSIAAAVSGGPDSVAMLHILFLLSREWRWRLVVVHVNHGFRGAESDREAAFVEELAAAWGLPCITGTIDVPAYIKESGANPQAAAREKRYEFLIRSAEEFGCTHIATGHHADDQAETILLRLLRGTGPAGLGGIPPARPYKNLQLIRPLLRITRGEISRYCEQQRLPYCQDSSNFKRKYARNRVRLDLLPALRSYNPGITATLGRLADLMRDENGFMEQMTTEAFGRIAQRESGGYRLRRSEFAGLHVALQRRLITLILSYLFTEPDSWDFVRTENARLAILQQRPTLSIDLGNGIRLSRDYDTVRFTSVQPVDAPPYEYILDRETNERVLPEAGVRVTCELLGRVPLDSVGRLPPEEAVFDFDELAFPLYVRNRREGDRMHVFGLNGSKKVKDIFINDKIPPQARSRMPLLFDHCGRLLWIPQVRRSAHAVATEKTDRFFRIRVERM